MQLTHSLFHFLDVPGNLDLWKDARDPTFAIDNHCRALETHVLAPVHGFLFPDAEVVSELVLLVCQEQVGKLELLLEFSMRLEAVRAHSDHDRIDLPESRKRIAKIARFLRAAGRVVLGIEEEDDVLSRRKKRTTFFPASESRVTVVPSSASSEKFGS